MRVEGGCFCEAIRYRSEGEPVFKGLCHCRQCQYFAGGAANTFMAVPAAGFAYTKGKPKRFTRPDAPVLPATREFCPECGVQLATRSPAMADVVFMKVGTLDDPAVFGAPELAIFLCDRQPFHHLAKGVAGFDKMPPMGPG